MVDPVGTTLDSVGTTLNTAESLNAAGDAANQVKSGLFTLKNAGIAAGVLGTVGLVYGGYKGVQWYRNSHNKAPEAPVQSNGIGSAIANVITAPFRLVAYIFSSPFVWIHNKMTDRAINHILNGTDAIRATALTREMGRLHFSHENHGKLGTAVSYVDPRQTAYKLGAQATVEERRSAYETFLQHEAKAAKKA